MAKGRDWRDDGQQVATDTFKGDARKLSGLHITGDGKGNFNVTHHYEEGGESGLGDNYQQVAKKLVSGEDMLSHVKVHSARLGKSAPKDERPEEDNYDAQGGDENER